MNIEYYSILIIISIYVFSGINNYLLLFLTQGKLPASIGYNLFAKFGHIAIFVVSVWSLGWFFGVMLSLLYIFNILNATISWVITYAATNKYISDNTEPELNLTLYGFFPFLVIIVIFITVLSFFIIDFGAISELLSYYDYSPLFVLLVISILCLILRLMLIKKYS